MMDISLEIADNIHLYRSIILDESGVQVYYSRWFPSARDAFSCAERWLAAQEITCN